MSDLPDPLVPPDVDLRDFPFLPIDITRLFGSDFHAQSNDGEWRAGVTLWLRSYHQVPAGSLPDDEVALARLAELGRDLKSWRKIRDGALRGWTKSNDGRLYHRTVSEKVLEGWIEKLAQRKASAAGNAKRYGHPFDASQYDDAIEVSRLMLAALNPQSRVLTKRYAKSPTGSPDGTPGGIPTESPGGNADGTPNDLPHHSQETGKGREENNTSRKRSRTQVDYTSDFRTFWEAYPTDRNMGKREAFVEWQKLDDTERQQAIASCPSFVNHCSLNPTYRPLHANRYLAKRRFEGHTSAPTSPEHNHRIDFGGGVVWPETSVLNAVNRWRSDPTTWPTDRIGPPPGAPGCMVPVRLLQAAA